MIIFHFLFSLLFRALEACVENPLGLLDHLWRFKRGQQLSPHLRWGSLADQDSMVPTSISEHMVRSKATEALSLSFSRSVPFGLRRCCTISCTCRCRFNALLLFHSFRCGPVLVAARLLCSTHLACAITFNEAVLWAVAPVLVALVPPKQLRVWPLPK